MRFLLLLLLAGFSFVSGKSSVPHYVIDLDQPAFDRLSEVAKKYGPTVGQVAKKFVDDRLPPELSPLLHIITKSLDKYLAEPYHSELAGFAHYGNISIDYLVVVQILYDFTAFCTSTVCVDEKNVVWHARNMDYGNNLKETDFLKNTSISLSYVKGGKTLFTSVTFAGLIGTFTGMRPGGYSITVDERDQGSFFENLVVALVKVITTKRLQPLTMLVRDTFQNVSDYNTALKVLTTAEMIAPCYFILGGLSGNQGAVITRDREKAVDVYTLSLAKNRWYVLETNYDHWVPPPPDDNRRGPAIKAMNKMGRGNITVQNLFKVIYTPPVMNQGTIYSTVMSASSSFLQSTIP